MMAALDACARLRPPGLLKRVRGLSMGAKKDVARAARAALVAMEGSEALVSQAEELLADPHGRAAEMGPRWLVAAVVQVLAALAPLHEETADALRERAAEVFTRHGAQLLGALAARSMDEPEARRLLVSIVGAVDSASALDQVLAGLCPLLGDQRLRPTAMGALAGLPDLSGVVEPTHLLLVLKRLHLLRGASPRDLGGVGTRLGRPRMTHGWEQCQVQRPGVLIEALPAPVLRDYSLWLLSKGSAADVARGMTLLEAMTGAGSLPGGGELQPLLAALMRLVSAGGPGRRALRLALKVRELLGPAGADQSPYRAAGGGDLEELDRALQRASERDDQGRPARLARELAGELEGALAQGADVEPLLSRLEARQATWAITPLVEMLDTSPGGPMEKRLEKTLAALARAQPDRWLMCLDCVERFEQRSRRTGLFSRVEYQVCRRCEQSGHYAPDIARVVLEVGALQRDWWHRVEGNLMRVDWRQCVLRDQLVCTVDEVALQTADRHTVEWFRSWYVNAGVFQDRGGRQPSLRAPTDLDPDLRGSLETLFTVS